MATEIYTPAPAGARERRGAARRWWVLAVASVAQLMVVLDVTVVNIALPSAPANSTPRPTRPWPPRT